MKDLLNIVATGLLVFVFITTFAGLDYWTWVKSSAVLTLIAGVLYIVAYAIEEGM